MSQCTKQGVSIRDVPPRERTPQMVSTANVRLRKLLKQFRDHVILNATQWRLGSMGSHHPLWAEINDSIGDA